MTGEHLSLSPAIVAGVMGRGLGRLFPPTPQGSWAAGGGGAGSGVGGVEGPGRAAHSPSSQMAAFIHNGCSGPVGSIDLHKKPDFTAQLSLSSLSPPFRPHLPCRGREVSD